MVCGTYFNIQKQFDEIIVEFSIWQQFWLHFEKLGNFFQTSGHSVQYPTLEWNT
jgi:hypothetical protein